MNAELYSQNFDIEDWHDKINYILVVNSVALQTLYSVCTYTIRMKHKLYHN